MLCFHVSDWGVTSPSELKIAVPGVAIRRKNTIAAHRNCAWLLDKALKESLCSYEITDDIPEYIYSANAFANGTDISNGPLGLRDGIWRDFMLPYQRRGVSETYNRPGAHYTWTAGSGKSLGALAWALCHPGRCLWITRAISKTSHRDQLLKYVDPTHNSFQILDGDGPQLLRVKAYLGRRRLARKAVVRLDNRAIGETNDNGEFVLTRNSFENTWSKLITYGRRILSVYHTSANSVASFDIDLQETTCGDLTVNFNAGVDGDPPPSIEGEVRAHIDPQARFVIINWEILAGWYKLLLQQEFASIVFDESKYAKNPKRFTATHIDSGEKPKFVPLENTSYAAYALSRSKSIVRRLGLDATPLRNRPKDLWAQLDILEPNAWGKRSDFMMRYANRHTGTFGQLDDNGASNLDELKLRFSFIQNRVSQTESHGALPPLRRETIYIPSNELVDLGEKKKIIALAGNSAVENAIFQAAARKRKYVLECVQESIDNRQNVTVFTGRREDAEDIYKRVASKNKKNTSALMFLAHGGVSTKERDSIRTAYMAAQHGAVLIATGDSMGEAIDLNRTDVAIIAQLPYTVAQLEQWEKRFWRLGSDRNVIIKYLIATGTIDEKIAQLLLSKLPAVEKLVSDDASSLTHTLMGGKSDEEIQSELLNMLLGG